VLRVEQHAWNVEVLRILQRFVNPRLKHFRTHVDLSILRLETRSLGGVFGLLPVCFQVMSPFLSSKLERPLFDVSILAMHVLP